MRRFEMGSLRFSRLFRLPLAAGLVVSFALLAAAPAGADVGVYKVAPRVGTPGESVELSIGCGACLAISVVRGRRLPPAAFPVSLVPLARASKPPLCAGSNAHCSPAPVVRPLRERPFVFLGRAKPLFTKQELKRIRGIPQYRLRFRIPRARPGAYAFVIYGGGLGIPLADTTSRARLLRVRSEKNPIAVEGHGTAAIWWFVATAALAVLVLAGVLVRRRRAG